MKFEITVTVSLPDDLSPDVTVNLMTELTSDINAVMVRNGTITDYQIDYKEIDNG